MRVATRAPLTDETGTRRFSVKLTRPLSGGLGARISGVTTKEEADALKGTQLYADRARLPRLPDDEFYHADLIGLEVRDTGGAVLGQVRAVQNHGAGGGRDVCERPYLRGRHRRRFRRARRGAAEKLLHRTHRYRRLWSADR